MNKVEIYTHPGCGYCHQAKGLLKVRGIPFDERDLGKDGQLAVEMVQRTGGRTVPQIVINDQPIGGFDSLHRLDKENKLQALIRQ